MSFNHDFNERERRIADLADGLARRFAPSAAEHDRNGSFPHAHYRALHEAGYLRLAIPREYGGEGASVFEMVLAQERLARGDAATAVAVGMLLNVIGAEAERRSWPAPLFAHVATTIAREGGLVNSVVSEPELGSISRGGVPATAATRVEGGWRIDGHKVFATGAPALRFLLVAVKLPASEAAPQGETARAVVEAPAEGLRLVPSWGANLAQRSGGSDDAYFENVFVPDDRLIERQPIGAPAPVLPVNAWWLTVAAAYLGVGQAALDAAVDYARHRVPTVLGQPIASQAHVQQWIGEMEVTLAAARAVLYDTARRWSARPGERPRLAPQIAAAKYLATNAACAATDLGLRVAGGFSLTRELTLERHFRDARGGLFMPPQDDLALALVGRELLAAEPA